jgi:hypothetical protein
MRLPVGAQASGKEQDKQAVLARTLDILEFDLQLSFVACHIRRRYRGRLCIQALYSCAAEEVGRIDEDKNRRSVHTVVAEDTGADSVAPRCAAYACPRALV